jgi:hypothetical protein
MVLSFCDENVRRLSVGREIEIENGFIELCLHDNDFLSSIESTTKSLTATQLRLSAWFTKLNHIIGSDLHVPKLVNNRIV